ncbi:Sodium/glucose cotransporter [compost metagenome]
MGFISPGVLAIFLLGFYWKRTTTAAAMTGALLTIPLSTVLKFLPVWTNGAFPDYPFLDRMAIDFVVIVVLMIVISLYRPKSETAQHAIEVDTSMFKISTGFALGSLLIMGILTALYTIFW